MDFALAALSGLLLAFSFPKFGHPAFGWIALAPLLIAIDRAYERSPASPVRTRLGSGPYRATLLGLAAGLVYFTGTLYWITAVMVTFGGLNTAVAMLVNALLVAYLAWFPALFALAMVKLRRLGRWALLLAPAVWVATEIGRGWLFGGFPWVLLGYSQVTVLPAAQFASVAGVFGVSALVALAAAAIAYVARERTPARWYVAAGCAAVVVGNGVWGAARIADGRLTREGEPLAVGLVQGNVAQEEKWDPARARAIFVAYLQLTRQAAAAGARFIIWPESSTPFFFEEDRYAAEAVRAVARQLRTELLIGSDQIERGPTPKYFNSAFMIGADGKTAGVYRKVHLVPFGEYVPLKDLFFFAGPLVEQVGGFTPGADVVMLPVARGRASTAICYEIVYPALVREAVNRGSQLLTTITNDAWYGHSSAPHQHFAQASMRAIEQGRYLARSANTGISGIVDPYGRVLLQSRLFERAALTGEVRLLTGRTIYARIGDAFAYACVALTLAGLLAARRTGRLPPAS